MFRGSVVSGSVRLCNYITYKRPHLSAFVRTVCCAILRCSWRCGDTFDYPPSMSLACCFIYSWFMNICEPRNSLFVNLIPPFIGFWSPELAPEQRLLSCIESICRCPSSGWQHGWIKVLKCLDKHYQHLPEVATCTSPATTNSEVFWSFAPHEGALQLCRPISQRQCSKQGVANPTIAGTAARTTTGHWKSGSQFLIYSINWVRYSKCWRVLNFMVLVMLMWCCPSAQAQSIEQNRYSCCDRKLSQNARTSRLAQKDVMKISCFPHTHGDLKFYFVSHEDRPLKKKHERPLFFD